MGKRTRHKVGLWIGWDESIDESKVGFSRDDLVRMAALALRENDIRILPKAEWPKGQGLLFSAEVIKD